MPKSLTSPTWSPPELPSSLRSKVLNLALTGYARVYAHNLFWAGADHPEDYVDMWLQLLTLDGLRVIFLELTRLDLAEMTCKTYDAWSSVMGHEFKGNPDAWRFERNFAETRGFVWAWRGEGYAGNTPSLPKATPVRSEATRELSLEELDTVLPSIERRLPAMALDHIETEMEDQWSRLSQDVKGYLQAAEESYLRQRFAHDQSGPGTQYRKAVEAVLAETEGRTYPGILGEYGDSTRVKLKSVLRSGAPVEELTRRIREFSSAYGNPPAHVRRGRYQPFQANTMRQGRRLALDIIREVTRWRK
jgi:hypothetical protein